MLWVICGAGKGVGKTHLSLALRRVLPNAAYAKLGHGPAKPGKPEDFFTCPNQFEAFVAAAMLKCAHVVAESNAWAIEGRGDLRIFIDGIPTTRSTRGDAEDLRSGAHIVVGTEDFVDTWWPSLGRHLPDCALRQEVCGALLEHSAYLRSIAASGLAQTPGVTSCGLVARGSTGSAVQAPRAVRLSNLGVANLAETGFET